MTNFEKMQVDLFSNMAVEKIIFDDRAPAKFTRELNAMFVQLPETVKRGSSHSVTVYYSGSPIVARRPPWQGGFTWEHDTNGNPWSWSPVRKPAPASGGRTKITPATSRKT